MENRNSLISNELEKKQAVLEDIFSRTIADDQAAIAEQWAKTFSYAEPDNLACNIALFTLSCIAQGDFKTRSGLQNNNELRAPSSSLTIADYLSHGSRVIIDYQGLSEENKLALLNYFPILHEKVISRSATHAVTRNNNGPVELKGLYYGAVGQLPTLAVTPKDFGTNIAIGGMGQPNFMGKTIAENGYSGHLYFHLNSSQHLLMVGLEQSAPHSLYDWIPHPAQVDPSIQTGADQFNQTHSMLGASDTVTAAGSIYFSDPLYQAKLLAEKNCAPPDKYGAMHVSLTDANFKEILDHFKKMALLANTNNLARLKAELCERPSTAVTYPDNTVKTYIAIDFPTYFKRIAVLLRNASLTETDAQNLIPLQQDLLSMLQALQRGDSENLWGSISNCIQKMAAIPDLPKPYRDAITRIELLVKKEMTVDQRYISLLVERQSNELIDGINDLLQQLETTRGIYAADFITRNNDIENFLHRLNEINRQLEKLLVRYKPDTALSDSISLDSSLSSSWAVSLDGSWVMPSNEMTLGQIQQDQAELNKLETLLSNLTLPTLCAKSELDQVVAENEQLKNVLTEQENALQQQDNILKNLAEAARLTHENNERILKEASEKGKILAPFYIQLAILKEKSENLEKRGETDAAMIANELCTNLRSEADSFVRGARQGTLDDFKQRCIGHIGHAKPVLEKQRGWKKILGNIGVCILGLGVGYVIAGLINLALNKRFLFFNETDTSTKADKIKQVITRIRKEQ